MRDMHVIQLLSEPWAILPAKLSALWACARLHASGVHLTAEEIRERIGAGPRTAPRPGGAGVAVIPIYGVIAQRMSMLTESSGGTSCEAVSASLRAALADPTIRSIVLDVDSPGGSVFGVGELAEEIYRARGVKRIVAVADSLAASAGYWIASAADEVVVTPGGLVGSIGVIAEHWDESASLEKEGLRVTLIAAGKHKGDAHPSRPLSEEALASIQSRVDGYYDAFARAVARHRGVSASAVRGGMGEGDVVGAAAAVACGLADRIATLDQTVGRLLPKSAPARDSRAEADPSTEIAAAAPGVESVADAVARVLEDHPMASVESRVVGPVGCPECPHCASPPPRCPSCGAGCPDDCTACPGCGGPMCCCPSCGAGCVAGCTCCPSCGAALKCCGKCGAGCAADATICPACGAAFDGATDAAAVDLEIEVRRRRLALI